MTKRYINQTLFPDTLDETSTGSQQIGDILVLVPVSKLALHKKKTILENPFCHSTSHPPT